MTDEITRSCHIMHSYTFVYKLELVTQLLDELTVSMDYKGCSYAWNRRFSTRTYVVNWPWYDFLVQKIYTVLFGSDMINKHIATKHIVLRMFDFMISYSFNTFLCLFTTSGFHFNLFSYWNSSVLSRKSKQLHLQAATRLCNTKKIQL